MTQRLCHAVSHDARNLPLVGSTLVSYCIKISVSYSVTQCKCEIKLSVSVSVTGEGLSCWPIGTVHMYNLSLGMLAVCFICLLLRVCLCVSKARPTLPITGAEYDEDDSTKNQNSSGQKEDFLPIGACWTVIRQGTCYLSSNYRCHGSHKLRQSHDLAGVERRQVQLVDVYDK